MKTFEHFVNELSHIGANTSWTSKYKRRNITLSLKDVNNYLNQQNIPVKYFDPKLFKDILIDVERDPQRVENANLDFPIIVVKKDNKFTKIIDGNHRIFKCLKNGIDKIKTRVLDLDKSPIKYSYLFEQFINELNEFDNKPSTHEAVDLLNFCEERSKTPEYIKSELAKYIKLKFSYITFKGNNVDWSSEECKKAGDASDPQQDTHPWHNKISDYIDSIKTQTIPWQEIPKLLNFLIYKGEENFLEKLKNIPNGTSIEEVKKIYIDLIKEKDKLYDRPKRDEMDNDSRISGIINSIVENNYDPPVLLSFNNKLYCIGGRTRLFACLALKKNPIVKIMK